MIKAPLEFTYYLTGFCYNTYIGTNWNNTDGYVKLSTLVVSLGEVEILIQHPTPMTHAGMSKEDRLAANITDGLVRYSAGIESVEDLIHNLKNALEKIN